MLADMDRYSQQLRGAAPTYGGMEGGGSGGQDEILPEEVAILESILGLIRRLAEESDVVRTALAAKQLVLLLFYLLAARVPSTLKAALLNTLAAFAVAPALAFDIWQALESAQILQTVPRSSGPAVGAAGDIRTDLEQVEALTETYPETAAFVRLLTVLITTVALPTMLGKAQRDPPGVEPYVVFVVENVFLRLRQRRYRDPAEMWTLFALTTRFFHQLVLTLPAATTTPAPEAADLQRHPGFRWLLALLAGTRIKDEACFKSRQRVGHGVGHGGGGMEGGKVARG